LVGLDIRQGDAAPMISTDFSSRIQKFISDNAPTILTTVGVTGTLVTAYLAGKASFRAAELIAREEEILQRSPFDRPVFKLQDKVRLVWTLYIPAAATSVTTIVSIIAANRVSDKRAAAMAAAFTISDRAFTEYKEKVFDRLGKGKEQNIRDEIAQDRVNKDPPHESSVIITGSGEVLCYELFTGRYFKSTMENIKKAQNDINHRILTGSSASLSEFYNLMDLPTTAQSDEVGWNLDRLLELRFSSVLTDDGRPCLSIDYSVVPIRSYWKIG